MDSTTGPGRLVLKVSAPRAGGSWLDPDGGTGRLDPLPSTRKSHVAIGSFRNTGAEPPYFSREVRMAFCEIR